MANSFVCSYIIPTLHHKMIGPLSREIRIRKMISLRSVPKKRAVPSGEKLEKCLKMKQINRMNESPVILPSHIFRSTYTLYAMKSFTFTLDVFVFFHFYSKLFIVLCMARFKLRQFSQCSTVLRHSVIRLLLCVVEWDNDWRKMIKLNENSSYVWLVFGLFDNSFLFRLLLLIIYSFGSRFRRA